MARRCNNRLGAMSYSFERNARGVPLVIALSSLVLSACALIGNLQQFDGARQVAPDADSDGETGEVEAAAEASADSTTGSEASADGPTDRSVTADGPVADASLDESSGPVNLVQNPGFEDGTVAWSSFSDGSLMPTITTSSTFVHSGLFAGYVTDRTQAFEGMVQEMGGVMLPGHTYAVNAWALFDIPDAGAGGSDAAPPPQTEPLYVTAAERCLDDGAAVVNYVNIVIINKTPDTWTQLTSAYTVSGNGVGVDPQCTLTGLELYVAGPAAGVDLYVDDVSVIAE
jgi:hypothetical protein